MNNNLIIILLVLALTFLIVIYGLKRIKTTGCVPFMVTFFIILCLNVLTFYAWVNLSRIASNVYVATATSEKYIGTVIAYDSIIIDGDDPKKKTFVKYTPLVLFTTNTGNKLTKELNFTVSKTKLGDTYRLYYNEKKNTVIAFSPLIYIIIPINIFACTLLSFLFIGIFKYALGYPMKGYYSRENLSYLFFKFGVPLILLFFMIIALVGISISRNPDGFPNNIIILIVFGGAMLIWGYMNSTSGMKNPNKLDEKSRNTKQTRKN
ncbi:hypothetical protein M4I21_13420 [Cellulophaga sp. 20_2_10]|uniref:hypothetical protein n=1 Tax=Cellulophaga sp. 20_2_10 TaxID=2942476 RepID=UPI00201B0A89|nr:hypothetical protein [Cellulophaga sp. 20_2_10]MCL5246819.1 hypothetical protein [Cellulophaga sp. 20_2_10]